MKSKILSLFFVVALFLSPSVWAVPTGAAAPDFKLPGVNGEMVSLSELKGKTVVLEWFNASCPFVKKHYSKSDMQALQKKWTDKGIVWLAIDSTNANHPGYQDLAALKKTVTSKGIAASSMLSDVDGKVGKQYSAKTTPHMFVINAEGKIIYQGAIDDNSDAFADPKKSKNYLDLVLSEASAGKPVSVGETPPYGCSVKYQ